MAKCIETNAEEGGEAICECQKGWQGDGIGLLGCEQQQQENTTNCSLNCLNGGMCNVGF